MMEVVFVLGALLMFAIGGNMLANPAAYMQGRRAWPPWAVRPAGLAYVGVGFVMLYLTYQLYTQG